MKYSAIMSVAALVVVTFLASPLSAKIAEEWYLLSERVHMVDEEPSLRVREIMLPTNEIAFLEYHQTSEGNLRLLVAEQSESTTNSLEMLCKAFGLSLDRNGEVSHSPDIVSTLPCVDNPKQRDRT
jgi:hypothetical protein